MPSRRFVATLAAVVVAVGAPGCANDPTEIRRVDSTTTTPTTSGDGPARSTTTTGSPAVAGADGVGDPLLPTAGNGGYDVRRYGLDIEVSDDRASIDATTTIDATATQTLSAFNLDLRGFDVTAVTVDGAAATVARSGDELTVTPADPIGADDEFRVVVAYRGTPAPVDDPSAPGTIGWLSATTGSGTYVAAEPTGAKGIFPSNDHPSDKAMFDISVTAAAGETVVANGVLRSEDPLGDGRTRWTFGQSDPMATYLVQIAVGDYDVVESTGPHGLPLRHAIVRSVPTDDRAVLDDTSAQIEFFERWFGPFPLDTYGLLVADSTPEFALETQTLTLLPVEWLSFGREAASSVMAHELAHQWFGDTVTPERWSDIWLNEGFATYGEWLWDEHAGGESVEQQAGAALTAAPRLREVFGPVAAPAATSLFSPNEYDGAAIVLHALRREIGDDAFFGSLRAWVGDHAGRSATTADFEAVVSRVAGRDLTAFFDTWLRSTTVPPFPG